MCWSIVSILSIALCRSGVPQGSVLSPLLLLIYINSLTKIPLSDSMRLTLYANDLLIYKPILTESSHLQLQGDINSISLWADNNNYYDT